MPVLRYSPVRRRFSTAGSVLSSEKGTNVSFCVFSLGNQNESCKVTFSNETGARGSLTFCGMGSSQADRKKAEHRDAEIKYRSFISFYF